uniref:Uncharacterized protein n=1 Tax=Strigamia maritima TaxID=126957 RepID=T1IGV4_STRMM
MLSATDLMWLQDESSGQSIISCLLFLERGLDLNAIRDLVFHRVIQAVHEDGRRMYPRLVQRVIPASAGYYWVEDDNFNIDNHIMWAPVHVRTKLELQSFVGALIEQPLPSERPLWEIRVIPYFDKNRDTVLFFRIHHCITDGTSLVKLLVHSLADGQLVPNAKPRFGGTAFPLNVFRALIIGPVSFFSWLFFTCQDHNFFRRRKKIADNAKVVAWSHDINLPQVTRIKQVTRSTLNDVILGALTGSLRNVLRSHGISNPYDLKINITIDLRYEPKHGRTWVPMGTEFSLSNVLIPTNTEGVIPQLWEVRSRLEELKTSADSVVMYGAIHVLHAFLPVCLAQWLVNCILRRASLLYSNIAGPEVPLRIGAHQLKSVVFWMPPRHNVPIALSVFTYSDTLKMSVVADKEILPNPQPIITEFVAQVISKMSKLLASRRTPGESRRRSFLLVGRENSLFKPPVEELQQKLHDVQDELHAITQRMDAAALMSPSPDQSENAALQHELFARVAELKEQFTDLLSELRRRKSLADGIPFSTEEDDDDMDGEVRRPRKRALSISSSRKSSISIMSTTRPLATTPTSSHHSVLSHSADSEPSSSPNQEQQRALLETEQIQQLKFNICCRKAF